MAGMNFSSKRHKKANQLSNEIIVNEKVKEKQRKTNIVNESLPNSLAVLKVCKVLKQTDITNNKVIHIGKKIKLEITSPKTHNYSSFTDTLYNYSTYNTI